MIRKSTVSLKKRYFFKLSSNIFNLFAAVIIQTIVLRTLGPAIYGYYSFLTNFFATLFNSLDMSTSTRFYIKLSQKQNEKGLIQFYWTYSIFICSLVFFITFFSFLFKIEAVIWPNQSFRYIWLAMFWGILTWYNTIIERMVDAYGLTVKGEIARIIQRFLGLLAILALFLIRQISLLNYFLYQYFILIFMIVAWYLIIKNSGYQLMRSRSIKKHIFFRFVGDFFKFSSPLFVFTIVGFLVNYYDRWFLEKVSGSIEQGFFGLSYQIGAICFLFSSAMTPLLIREFSIAHYQNDINKMKYLFRRHIPLLYSVAAYIACFVSIQAQSVLVMIGGGQFKNALFPVMIMALYPIHQTYGQLSGSVFFATGQTRLYRNIGIVLMLLGIPLTYILLAPKAGIGFELAATGLALKMFLINILIVNVYLYYNTKYLNVSFMRYFLHQFGCLLAFLFLALISKIIVDQIFVSGNLTLLKFTVSGFIYTVMSLIMVFIFPLTISLHRKDFESILSEINQKLSLLRGK